MDWFMVVFYDHIVFDTWVGGHGKNFCMTSENGVRRLSLIGGFLGAGKTTLIRKFSEWLSYRDFRLGLVSNDQGSGLIDTGTFVMSPQEAVAEVTGGCFCCRLDDLVNILERMSDESKPDVIVAEPVGSCTDLMATVLQPLERVYGLPLDLCPLSVVLDGRRALASLGGRRDPRDFHRDVGYIYRKQIEEAEWLVVNKRDLLTKEQLNDLLNRLEGQFPGKRVFVVSGKTGEGLDEWFGALMSESSLPAGLMEMDYDRYGRGEAMLGWYNAEIAVDFEHPTAADAWLLETSSAISRHLAGSGCKVAHFKTSLEHPDGRSRAHQVMDEDEVSLAESHAIPVSEGRLLVNLRAEGDPKLLDEAVDRVLGSQAGVNFKAKASFQPGQPRPTHRVEQLVTG